MESSNGVAHVFFVDDEPRVCRTVHKTLARAGLKVQCFTCAEDCLRHLALARCDLLITDVKLPGKDGMDLLHEAKAQAPWLPVLVVTGYADVPLAVRALKTGAVDFVEKPLDRDSFLQTVQRVLERNAGPASLLAASLTSTERKVLHLLLEGRSSREIGDILHRSPRTVEAHRSHLMQKLEATNIIELLRRAADLGLLPLSPAGSEGSATEDDKSRARAEQMTSSSDKENPA